VCLFEFIVLWLVDNRRLR